MADSITTWRMAMLASTEHGALGSGPRASKSSRISSSTSTCPSPSPRETACRSPSPSTTTPAQRGDVALKLQSDDWFSLADDIPDKSVSVDSDQVGGSQFTLEAKRIGKFKLTLSAQMKGSANRADIVVREIEVVPNGREQNTVFNGRLDASGRGEPPRT